MSWLANVLCYFLYDPETRNSKTKCFLGFFLISDPRRIYCISANIIPRPEKIITVIFHNALFIKTSE